MVPEDPAGPDPLLADEPAKVFRKIEELAASMKAQGVLEPVLVRPTYETTDRAAIGRPLTATLANFPGLREKMLFELIAGERRCRAAKAAGLAEVPAIVREMDDKTVLEIQVVENDQREDVDPLDQAHGYRALLDRAGYDVPALAKKIGRSQSYVYERLQLTKLIKPVEKLLEEGTIHFGHAALLARLTEKDQKEAVGELGQRVKWGEGVPSVGQLKSEIEEKYHLDLGAAAFPKDDGEILPSAGPCTTCPKRTGFVPELFPDVKKKDTCTDRTCFEQKRDAFLQIQIKRMGVPAAQIVKVSTDYSNKAGVLNPYQYEEVAKKDAGGKDVTQALVVDGRGAGKIVQVRVKKQPGRPGADPGTDDKYRKEQKAREAKAKRQQALHFAVLEGILSTIQGEPGMDAMRRMARTVFDRVYNDVRVALCKRHGWERPVRTPQHAEWMTKVAGQAIDGFPPADLHRFVVEASLIGPCHVSAYSDCRVPEELKEAAAAYGVDIEKIRAELKAGEAPAKGRKSSASLRDRGETAPPPDNVNKYVKGLEEKRAPLRLESLELADDRRRRRAGDEKLDVLTRQGIVERLLELAEEAGIEVDPRKDPGSESFDEEPAGGQCPVASEEPPGGGQEEAAPTLPPRISRTTARFARTASRRSSGRRGGTATSRSRSPSGATGNGPTATRSASPRWSANSAFSGGTPRGSRRSWRRPTPCRNSLAGPSRPSSGRRRRRSSSR